MTPKMAALLKEVAERRERQDAAKRRILAALTIGTEWTNGKRFCGSVTGDPAEIGRVRLTLFDDRGPYGHRTRDTLADLVQVIIDDLGENARVEIGCVDKIVGGAL